jgi:hypothetical protein
MGMSEDYEECVTPIRSDISTFSRGNRYLVSRGVMYRPDVRFFAPVTDDLQATVFEILVKIAASREDPEVLNGRDDWI